MPGEVGTARESPQGFCEMCPAITYHQMRPVAKPGAHCCTTLLIRRVTAGLWKLQWLPIHPPYYAIQGVHSEVPGVFFTPITAPPPPTALPQPLTPSDPVSPPLQPLPLGALVCLLPALAIFLNNLHLLF